MVEVARHYGHEVVVARYEDRAGNPVAHAIECMDCYEIITDEEVGQTAPTQTNNTH